MTRKKLLCSALLVAVGCGRMLAAGPDCKAPPSDSTFGPYSGQQIFVGGDPGTTSTARSYMISRVVGPGTPGEFDNNGFLTESSWNSYVANGVLSKFASIYVGAGQVDGGYFPQYAGNVSVVVNGHSASGATFVGFGGFGGCIDITTRWLRFPVRGANGNPPTPADNEIQVAYDNAAGLQAHEIGAGTSSLSFQAMAPVVLLTGCCTEDYTFWNSPTFGSTLKSKFDSLKIPYDDGSTFTNKGMITGTIESGATTVAVRASLVARSFGAQWVHLVGHSKGGLWARDAFRLMDVGVLSLTTLDTPHEGSIGADVSEQRRLKADIFDLPPTVRLVLSNREELDDTLKPFYTIRDLTQESLRRFNKKRPNPPGTTRVGGVERELKSYALSSDANSDCSVDNKGYRKISSLEATGM